MSEGGAVGPGPSGVAELLSDGGAAAAGDQFFRSAEFFAAEAVDATLRIRVPGVELLTPLVLRDVPDEGGYRDAISPYGYPGFGGTPPAPLDPAAIDWSATGLVTIFIRHRLGAPPPLAGATARNTVLLADPELPRKSRMSDRQQIRKNLKAGFEVAITPGPETTAEQRAAFHRAYTETMHRTGAAPRYFFDLAYFEAVLSAAGTWLFLVREPGGEVAAASIATRSDGMLHYYLSGTADAHLRGAPMKNILAEMTDFAWEMGLPLNLGGGITPGDRLEEFKRGFANREERFHTSEIICDPEAYEGLGGGRVRAGQVEPAAGGEGPAFFPAYRAPTG